MSKTKSTCSANAGHPDTRRPGIIRAKAYGGREIFAVIYSDYDLFGSPSLPQLALDQDMIQNLDKMTKSRNRVYMTRRSRESIHQAWEANRRHVRAIANPQSLTKYGNRNGVTFCLDTILKMWRDRYFDLGRNPLVGPLSRTALLILNIVNLI